MWGASSTQLKAPLEPKDDPPSDQKPPCPAASGPVSVSSCLCSAAELAAPSEGRASSLWTGTYPTGSSGPPPRGLQMWGLAGLHSHEALPITSSYSPVHVPQLLARPSRARCGLAGARMPQGSTARWRKTSHPHPGPQTGETAIPRVQGQEEGCPQRTLVGSGHLRGIQEVLMGKLILWWPVVGGQWRPSVHAYPRPTASGSPQLHPTPASKSLGALEPSLQGAPHQASGHSHLPGPHLPLPRLISVVMMRC